MEVETEKSNQRGNYNDLLVIAGAQADALFEEAKRKNAVDGALKSARDRAEKILLSFANKQGEVEVEVEAPSPTPTPTPKITPTENLPSFQKPKMNDVYVVSKWLSTKLNIEIDDPKALLQAPYISSEFMSGLKVSERSERVLRKTSILAMNPAKWLQTATYTTELTYSTIFARSLLSCFIENAPRFARSSSFEFAKNCCDGKSMELTDTQKRKQPESATAGGR